MSSVWQGDFSKACSDARCLLPLQDHARAFAGSQSDESKYKLYMKAMGFDAIIEKQKASEKQLHQVRDYLNEWKERLEVSSLCCCPCLQR